MKLVGLLVLFVSIISIPAFAQLESPGLVNRATIDAHGSEHEVVTVANFDVNEIQFNEENLTLTLSIMSSLEDSLGEITIPKKLLDGDLTFLLDGDQITPKVQKNDKISFITLQFSEMGSHKLNIIGTTHLQVPTPGEGVENPLPDESQEPIGGCLIATATYGSELSDEIQKLREIRDNKLLKTQSGAKFMEGFNQIYYSFSPTIADWERQNPAFKETVKLAITPLITSLSVLNSVNIDSEAEVLGYGMGVILANMGLYFGLPIFGIIQLRKKIR